ncbi:MAG: hypothetical protein ABWX59_03605 [Microbacteriaceae bacterium]
MTETAAAPERAQGFHGYPCLGPGYAQNSYHRLPSSVPWNTLQRCAVCGALRESGERALVLKALDGEANEVAVRIVQPLLDAATITASDLRIEGLA